MPERERGEGESWEEAGGVEGRHAGAARDEAAAADDDDDDEEGADDVAAFAALYTRPLARSDAKVQRWIDLLAALLVRRTPATFAELTRAVPAYAATGRGSDAVARMFERDKDELRRLGIAIETVPPGDDGSAAAYSLPAKRFYLPYLAIAARSSGGDAQQVTPAAGRSYGYRGLGTETFAPDELQAIADAVDRVKALGDPVLSEECEWGARKLALELPLPDAARTSQAGQGDIVLPTARAAPVTFERLADALTRRKRCTFTYFSISRNARATRTVEPFGLFFLGGHWYLAARDPALGDVRNFRLSRMSDVQVNTARAQTADYEPPDTFVLRDHAAERHPWELGDGSETIAEVKVEAWTGATRAAARLAESGEPGGDGLRYRVRRLDAFARWLMAFGGDMRPVAPPALVRAYREMVRQTLERYQSATTGEGATQP